MDIHSKLETLDFIVIAVYVVALVSIGMWVSYRRRGAEDLFLAGRSLGWPNVGLSIFGTNVNPSFLIASCSIAYTSGMVAANFEWLAWWFIMLLAMVFVPHYLGTRISTMPEFIKRRFGRRAYTFLSYYALFTTLVIWLGGVLYTGGVLLGQIMGWDLWLAVLVLTVIATSFTVAGGLAAVVVTDAFQSVLMILGAAFLTGIALFEVGGIEKMFAATPDSYWQLIRPLNAPDFPWHAMFLGYPVMGVWFWCTDQTIVQRVLGAKDLRHGQYGAVFAGFLKILPPFIFMLPGILCYVLHPNLENPDHAFATMVTTYLQPGMVGSIVAVLIAAPISTLDSGLNSFSTVFTLDIYVRNFRPKATPGEIRWTGRVATVLTAGIAVGCAISMDSFGKDLFNLLQGIIAFVAPPMAAVFLIGVLWKRATAKAALSALIVGSIVSLSIGFCHFKAKPDVLELTGPDTLANFQQVLRTVTYDNAAATPQSTPRIVTITANDGTHASNLAKAVIGIGASPDADAVARRAAQGESTPPDENSPVLDLDADDSSGAAHANFQGQFTPGQGPALVVDVDATLQDLDGPELNSMAVTLTNRWDDAEEALAADTAGTSITAVYHRPFWPHFLLLSFYLFVGIAAFMIAVSLVTKNSPEEESLPTLKETYALQGATSKTIWLFWGALAAITLVIYCVFN